MRGQTHSRLSNLTSSVAITFGNPCQAHKSKGFADLTHKVQTFLQAFKLESHIFTYANNLAATDAQSDGDTTSVTGNMIKAVFSIYYSMRTSEELMAIRQNRRPLPSNSTPSSSHNTFQALERRHNARSVTSTPPSLAVIYEEDMTPEVRVPATAPTVSLTPPPPSSTSPATQRHPPPRWTAQPTPTSRASNSRGNETHSPALGLRHALPPPSSEPGLNPHHYYTGQTRLCTLHRSPRSPALPMPP